MKAKCKLKTKTMMTDCALLSVLLLLSLVNSSMYNLHESIFVGHERMQPIS